MGHTTSTLPPPPLSTTDPELVPGHHSNIGRERIPRTLAPAGRDRTVGSGVIPLPSYNARPENLNLRHTPTEFRERGAQPYNESALAFAPLNGGGGGTAIDDRTETVALNNNSDHNNNNNDRYLPRLGRIMRRWPSSSHNADSSSTSTFDENPASNSSSSESGESPSYTTNSASRCRRWSIMDHAPLYNRNRPSSRNSSEADSLPSGRSSYSSSDISSEADTSFTNNNNNISLNSRSFDSPLSVDSEWLPPRRRARFFSHLNPSDHTEEGSHRTVSFDLPEYSSGDLGDDSSEDEDFEFEGVGSVHNLTNDEETESGDSDSWQNEPLPETTQHASAHTGSATSSSSLELSHVPNPVQHNHEDTNFDNQAIMLSRLLHLLTSPRLPPSSVDTGRDIDQQSEPPVNIYREANGPLRDTNLNTTTADRSFSPLLNPDNNNNWRSSRNSRSTTSIPRSLAHESAPSTPRPSANESAPTLELNIRQLNNESETRPSRLRILFDNDHHDDNNGEGNNDNNIHDNPDLTNSQEFSHNDDSNNNLSSSDANDDDQHHNNHHPDNERPSSIWSDIFDSEGTNDPDSDHLPHSFLRIIHFHTVNASSPPPNEDGNNNNNNNQRVITAADDDVDEAEGGDNHSSDTADDHGQTNPEPRTGRPPLLIIGFRSSGRSHVPLNGGGGGLQSVFNRSNDDDEEEERRERQEREENEDNNDDLEMDFESFGNDDSNEDNGELPFMRSTRFPRRSAVSSTDGHARRNRGGSEYDHDRDDSRQDNSNRLPRNSWLVWVFGSPPPGGRTPLPHVPSLFSDNPTYEDLLAFESYMGVHKPPVATRADVANADGIFFYPSKGQDGYDEDGRCQVCLCQYEPQDPCRKLTNCDHYFHKECVDRWLMDGRNSCPLCRRVGILTKEMKRDMESQQSSEAQ